MIRQEETTHIRYWIIGGALLCFAFFAWQVTAHEVLAFDTAVRTWVYSLRTPSADRIITGITHLGDGQTVTLILICLVCLPQTRKKIGLPAMITTLVSTMIHTTMKAVITRPRPELAVRLVEVGGWSFPSGHAMNSLVCFGMVIYLTRRCCADRRLADGITIGLAILIAAIGCSRIYVGVHFPTDILGGWSLGLAILLSGQLIWEKAEGKRERKAYGGNH